MKSLCQAYANKIKKIRNDQQEVKKKVYLKTFQCLISYFESSQNDVSLKEWEFLKKLLISIQQKYGILMRDLIDL